MKKSIQREIHFCDKCGREISYAPTCLHCGLELCYDCETYHGKRYAGSTVTLGSGDGFYCNECDSKLTSTGKNKLHNAYRAIQRLKDEMKAFETDWERRSAEANHTLKRIASN
jgi:hypothetical protein